MDHNLIIKQNWRKRANDSIAQGALTNSKRPSCFVEGVYPTHSEKSKGCYIYSANGQRYIDFIGGLGTNLLGYGNDEIADAVGLAARSGSCPSLPSYLEVQLAEKLKEFFPWVEKWRFLKSGSEACSAAVKIARAHQGTNLVYSDGYHGWHDTFTSITPPAIGVVETQCVTKELSEIATYAAKIIEPVMLDSSRERIEEVKRIKQNYSGLLINDEIITGFRYKDHSVSKHHSLNPDLICLGKAVANGFPLSLIGGKSSVMECDEYFVSSTFAGDTIAITAALKTLELLRSKYDINELIELGERFVGEFNALNGPVKIKGYPTRGVLEADPLHKALFMQEACKAGVLFGSSWFISFAHREVIDDVLKICESVFFKIKNGMAKLEGKAPVSPFAERVRR